MVSIFPVDDRLTYTWDSVEGYRFFELHTGHKDEIESFEIETRPYRHSDTHLELNFESVGAFEEVCVTERSVRTLRSAVRGKAMRAGKVIVSIPQGCIDELYAI